jgi:hypothetical protein
MAGIPLTRFPSTSGTHIGNNNLITIARTDNNILENNGIPYVDLNYGVFIENLGDFYKFNNKGKGEERLEEMVEEGRINENENKNESKNENKIESNNEIENENKNENKSESNNETENNMETTNNNDIQPSINTEPIGEFNIDQFTPLTIDQLNI